MTERQEALYDRADDSKKATILRLNHVKVEYLTQNNNPEELDYMLLVRSHQKEDGKHHHICEQSSDEDHRKFN